MHHTRSTLTTQSNLPLLGQTALAIILTSFQSRNLTLQRFLLYVVLMYISILIDLVATVLNTERIGDELFICLLFEVLPVTGYLLFV